MELKNTVIIFPGQGSQVLNMGRDFYDKYSSAKAVYHLVDNILGYNLSSIIFGEDQSKLNLTQYAQLAIMTTSVAVLHTIESEFNPDFIKNSQAVAGHSVGEYSALYAAKSINLDDAVQLLHARGTSMASAMPHGTGGMAALLGGNIDNIKNLIANAVLPNEVLCIANDNNKDQVVISGNMQSIDSAIAMAKDFQIKKAIKLPVSGSFHSALMKNAELTMNACINEIDFKAPITNFISNVSAEYIDQKDIKALMLKQITSMVRWRELIDFAISRGAKYTIEIGGSVLSSIIRRAWPEIETISINSVDDMQKLSEL